MLGVDGVPVDRFVCVLHSEGDRFELIFSLPQADSIGAHANSAGLYVFQSWTSRGIQKRLWDYNRLKLNLTVDFACPRIPRIKNLSFEEKRPDHNSTHCVSTKTKDAMIPKNELPNSVSDGLHCIVHSVTILSGFFHNNTTQL